MQGLVDSISMNRRKFVLTGGAAMALPAGAADTKPALLELRVYKLRNTSDMMPRRATEFFTNAAVPAMKRAGMGPVGIFQSLIAPDSPFLMTLAAVPNMAAYETALDKMATDAELTKQREALVTGPLPYVRFETSLLRGFATFPTI